MKVLGLLNFSLWVMLDIFWLLERWCRFLVRCVCWCYWVKLRVVLLWKCWVSVCGDSFVYCVYCFRLWLFVGLVISCEVICSSCWFCGIGRCMCWCGVCCSLFSRILIMCCWCGLVVLVGGYLVMCSVSVCSRLEMVIMQGLLGSLWVSLVLMIMFQFCSGLQMFIVWGLVGGIQLVQLGGSDQFLCWVWMLSRLVFMLINWLC